MFRSLSPLHTGNVSIEVLPWYSSARAFSSSVFDQNFHTSDARSLYAKRFRNLPAWLSICTQPCCSYLYVKSASSSRQSFTVKRFAPFRSAGRELLQSASSAAASGGGGSGGSSAAAAAASDASSAAAAAAAVSNNWGMHMYQEQKLKYAS